MTRLAQFVAALLAVPAVAVNNKIIKYINYITKYINYKPGRTAGLPPSARR